MRVKQFIIIFTLLLCAIYTKNSYSNESEDFHLIGKFFKNEFSVKSDEILSAFTNNKWILNFFRHRITKFIYLIKYIT